MSPMNSIETLRPFRSSERMKAKNLLDQIVRELGDNKTEIAARIGTTRVTLDKYIAQGFISLYGPARALAELSGTNPDLIADYASHRELIARKLEERLIAAKKAKNSGRNGRRRGRGGSNGGEGARRKTSPFNGE